MNEPQWIALDVVLAIHEAQLSEHGGSMGVRDFGLLESALARPKNLYSYSNPVTLHELGAAYAFGLVKNHPFADGNKRTAWVVCAVFIELNGLQVNVDQAQVVHMVVGLAAGQLSESQFAAWLQDSELMS